MAWEKQRGSANRYLNTETGETISRRQYDARFGTLARSGFTSYEQRQKAERALEKDFHLSQTKHLGHYLGRGGDIEKKIQWVIDRFGRGYGMQLIGEKRDKSKGFSTPPTGLGDFDLLLDYATDFSLKYGLELDEIDLYVEFIEEL